jgi:hypothetical protein
MQESTKATHVQHCGVHSWHKNSSIWESLLQQHHFTDISTPQLRLLHDGA